MAHSDFDWQKGVTVGCTSARVIAALCDVIDRGAGAPGDRSFLELTDRWPLPYQGALLEAEELGLPEPYIWDIEDA